jgi:[ribosomal protein S5]-alanine N-acetyltransferase
LFDPKIGVFSRFRGGEDTLIILETQHLLFRPLTLSDLDDLAALYADPAVMRFLGGPRSKDEVRHVLNRYIREKDT